MTVARIVKDKYVDLTGIGAKLHGARWNSPGNSVVYMSSCGALAALEYTFSGSNDHGSVAIDATLDIALKMAAGLLDRARSVNCSAKAEVATESAERDQV